MSLSLPGSFQAQFFKDETVAFAEAVGVTEAIELVLASLACREVAFTFSWRYEVLLDPVDIQHDNSAESVILCKPEGTKDLLSLV